MTGERLPAEWEPHAATWLAWPHRRATFLGPFSEIAPAYERLARLVAAHEPVRIIGSSEVLAEPRALLADVPNVAFVEIPTNDSWIRDTGPVFLVPRDRGARPPVAVCWNWNAWGGKYPPWDADARVARRVAEHLGLEVREPGIVLEGGAIETDGDGTLLVNERCVVDPRRNPGLDRVAMEAALVRWLAVDRVLWVEGDLAGDDTDGHIDQLARVDARGRRLEVLPVDIPARFAFERTQLPASHLNFVVANGLVAVPVFDGPTDEPALATIAACFPERRVEPVDCRGLVRGRGGLHCITRDEPPRG
jgi:agmatine deiminase